MGVARQCCVERAVSVGHDRVKLWTCSQATTSCRQPNTARTPFLRYQRACPAKSRAWVKPPSVVWTSASCELLSEPAARASPTSLSRSVLTSLSKASQCISSPTTKSTSQPDMAGPADSRQPRSLLTASRTHGPQRTTKRHRPATQFPGQ